VQSAQFDDESVADWPAVADARVLQSNISANTFAYLSGLTGEQIDADTELHFSDGDTAVRTPH